MSNGCIVIVALNHKDDEMLEVKESLNDEVEKS